MEHAKKLLASTVRVMVHEKQLQCAPSLKIPFFVLKYELCKKSFLFQKYNDFDLHQVIKDVLIEKFNELNERIVFSDKRVLQPYRGLKRRAFFVYGLDLSFDSEANKRFVEQDDPDFETFFKEQVVLDSQKLCPCHVMYDRVRAVLKRQDIRPIDIKQYVLQHVPGVTMICKKRREYKGEKIDANFFVGLDVKDEVKDEVKAEIKKNAKRKNVKND